LPKDAELLDTLVAGRRVELERDEQSGSRDWDAYKINVARAGASDQPFVMALVFKAPFKDKPLRGRGGKLKLPLPRLGGALSGSAVAVQQSRAVLWIPKEFALVGAPEGMEPLQPTWLDFQRGAVGYVTDASEVERWFGDSTAGLFAFAAAGHAYPYARLGTAESVEVTYWQTRWYTWWISGALLLAGIALSRTGWENRLTLLLLALFAAAMGALADTDLVLNGLAAARFGLLAMLGWWVVSSLARPRPPGRAEGAPNGAAAAIAALAAVVPPPGLFENQAREQQKK
jgi:hypothetical protein